MRVRTDTTASQYSRAWLIETLLAFRGASILCLGLILLLAYPIHSQNVEANKPASSQVLEIGILPDIPGAEPVELATPVYPGGVHAMGDVVVRVFLDRAGTVALAEAVSGHPLLRAAVVEAARKSRFKIDSMSTRKDLSGTITYAFRFGDVGYDDLRFFIDQQMAIRGAFSLRGKIGPFVLVTGKPVYLVARGSFEWEKYADLEGKDVIVTGTLRFHRSPVTSQPAHSAAAGLPDYFYFEAESVSVQLEKR
jgi:hypothetical protein